MGWWNTISDLWSGNPNKLRDDTAQPGNYMSHLQDTNKMIDSLKRGGPIKKTGMYRLHKGERVLNKKQELARKMTKKY